MQSMELARSIESLKAAKLCLRESLVNSAVSRAYYAMFHAAQVALEAAGLVRSEWSHKALHASFNQELIHRKLTELALLALKLCPEARVKVTTRRYENEDGRLKVFPPPGMAEAEEEKPEEALTERCVNILEQTELFILCAVFDAQA